MTRQRPRSSAGHRLLERLAARHGIQTTYRDAEGGWRESPPGSVLLVLAALGVELEGLSPAGAEMPSLESAGAEHVLAAALEAGRSEARLQMVEPVLVAWDGLLPALTVCIPQAGRADSFRYGRVRQLRLTLALEDGTSLQFDVAVDRLMTAQSTDAEERSTRVMPAGMWRRVLREHAVRGGSGRVDGCLPCGYHSLIVEAGSQRAVASIIAAPRRCWIPNGHSGEAAADDGRKAEARNEVASWGVFAPAYALRSARDWGAGDLAELAGLCGRVGKAGGAAVSTLPLLAAFLDRPFEPAPYRPVSRLFWNEFFLPVEHLPEFASCPGLAARWSGPETSSVLGRLRNRDLVDYREVMALKRGFLERMAQHFFAQAGATRREAFRTYVQAHAEVEDYAAFRAEVEERGADWREWPDDVLGERARPSGREDRGGGETREAARRYHLYCQWQTEEWLAAIASQKGSAPLFLDLPVGVHPGGYDTWRWRDLFVSGLSAGAPPDGFFTLGQDWQSPPLHPQRARGQGHEYFASCLRHAMGHAGYLRIDHVMSLHRLYVIPSGVAATDGVYLTYPAEELHAVVTLESHRRRTMVVGEDLGTVPTGVRASMARHGLRRTWVFQTSLRPRATSPVGPIPKQAAVGLNTHDMFPFAGFLQGADIAARVETGQLSIQQAAQEREVRRRVVDRLTRFFLQSAASAGADPAALLPPVLAFMARGVAGLVLVNLEDLFFETRPQNVPGTGVERPNWSRKMRSSDLDTEQAVTWLGRLWDSWSRASEKGNVEPGRADDHDQRDGEECPAEGAG